MFPGQFLSASPNPPQGERSRPAPRSTMQGTSSEYSPRPWEPTALRKGPESLRWAELTERLGGKPSLPRVPAGRPDHETREKLCARPSPGPRHSGFTHEFPLRNASRWPRTASGRRPPQGQFQGRNCFGLGFGSENKHSGFYRFTRVGCCFPFQQLLNQAFHSEASGL